MHNGRTRSVQHHDKEGEQQNMTAVEKRGRGTGPFEAAQLFSICDTVSSPPKPQMSMIPSIWGLIMTAIPISTANFSSELASALKENSFGLKNYQIVRETQLESVATVVLLEGDMATISLSPRGFEVSSLICCATLFTTPLMIDILCIRSWIRRQMSSMRHSNSCWFPSVELIVSRANKLYSHGSRNSQPQMRTRGICPVEFHGEPREARHA